MNELVVNAFTMSFALTPEMAIAPVQREGVLGWLLSKMTHGNGRRGWPSHVYAVTVL
jgi:hypothetical protein